jgi:hypothetical protein
MKKMIFYFTLVFAAAVFASGCGQGSGDPVGPRAAPETSIASGRAGGSDSPARVRASDSLAGSSDAGILSLHIGDGKPLMPSGTRGVVITIDEASVYESEKGWISLPLARSPLPVDLLQFTEGRTYPFVPNSRIPPGKYNRVRIGISKAVMRSNRGALEINVPPYSREPDMAFPFEVKGGEWISLTVAFDVGRSLIDRGSNYFTLDPVLRIVATQKAAVIEGNIKGPTFGATADDPYADKRALVEVYWDRNNNLRPDGDELLTKINVENWRDPAPFGIHWLAPERNYIVSVRVEGKEIYREVVEAENLPAGNVWALNNGKPL